MKQLLHFQKIISRYVPSTIPKVPSNITAHIPHLRGIKAVAFDVYGTLLHCTMGEINTYKSAQKLKLEFPYLSVRINSDVVIDMVQHEIHAQHAVQHAQGIRYPEVDIVTIWKKILQREKLFSEAVASYRTITECAMDTALYYELQVNPVSPMPHALNIIRTLHKAGIVLGIVSNAQFYTAHVLKCLLSQNDEAGNNARYNKILKLFSTCVWSYKLGEGKPSTRLYETLLHTWNTYKPYEIMFVGNDMCNDIVPPATLGIKTALFAGDAQSYKPREDIQELTSIKPDACITDLMSIAHIVGIT